MTEPTREQLIDALRKADAAGDEAAARAIARRIQAMGAKPETKKPATEADKKTAAIKDANDKLRGKAGYKDLLTQGFTFGLSDEAAGIGNAISNAIAAPFSRKVDFNPIGSYKSGVRSERARLDEARSNTGGLGVATEIAGGFLSGNPTKAVTAAGTKLGRMYQGVKEGAKLGALGGFGYGEGVEGKVAGTLGGATLGSVLGGALASRGPQNVRPNEIKETATRLGVRPTPATTGGPVKQTIQMGLGNMPGSSGPVAKAVIQEADDLAAAARRTASTLGPVSTPKGAGEKVIKGAQAFKRASSAKGNALYSARDRLMGGKDAPVLLGSASREINSFASEFPNTPLLASIREHPAVRKLSAALPEGSAPELTVKEATEALSHIRGALRNAERSNTVTGAIKSRIARVEQAIEDDVMRAAAASDAIAGRAGQGSAQAAQTEADKFWAQRSSTLQGPLKTALDATDNRATIGAEKVYRQMVSDMGREGGNHARLRQAWSSLPSGAKRTFSATAFDDLGRAKPGAQDYEGAQWSFNTFLTNYDKMAPEARKLVFGGKGVDKQIEDIARYASRLRDLDKSRNFSNTARATLAGAYLTVVGGQLWEGDVPGAIKSAAALPAMALTGKVFVSSPSMRLWTRQALTAMTTKNPQRKLEQLTSRLPVIAQQNPALREEVMSVFRAINDNYPKNMAASEGQAEQK